jgi:hypothetical protein
MSYLAEVTQVGSLSDKLTLGVKAAADGKILAACLAGGEAGVGLADAYLNFKSSNQWYWRFPNRRTRKIQQELIRRSA